MELHCERATLDLSTPQSNANARWSQREMLSLRVLDEAGYGGLGEASPLPGYSPDDVSSCQATLRALSRGHLAELAEARTVGEIAQAVSRVVPRRLPAARFGLETALLDRSARRQRLPLWRLLASPGEGGRPGASHVRLCALLDSAHPAAALARARRLAERGVSTFKLKIGPRRLLSSQRACLQALRSEFREPLELRLDANRSLEPSGVEAVLGELSSFSPEFVEEPVPTDAFERVLSSGCPLALDESLGVLDSERMATWLGAPALRVLVLKPTLLGGLSRCLELARQARGAGVAVVVSHVFEGKVAWTACAHLALALASPLAAGLWPLSHQAGGSVFGAGRLNLPAAPGLGLAPARNG